MTYIHKEIITCTKRNNLQIYIFFLIQTFIMSSFVSQRENFSLQRPKRSDCLLMEVTYITQGHAISFFPWDVCLCYFHAESFLFLLLSKTADVEMWKMQMRCNQKHPTISQNRYVLLKKGCVSVFSDCENRLQLIKDPQK